MVKIDGISGKHLNLTRVIHHNNIHTRRKSLMTKDRFCFDALDIFLSIHANAIYTAKTDEKVKRKNPGCFFFGGLCFDKTRKDTLNPLGRLFF